MNDWIGKQLDDGLNNYFLTPQAASIWLWILAINLSFGLLFAIPILLSDKFTSLQKSYWVVFGFLLPPIAILLYIFRERRQKLSKLPN